METSDNLSGGLAETHVQCAASRDRTVRQCIAAALLAAFGIWCLMDRRSGRYDYPAVPFSTDTINTYAGWAFNFFGSFLFPLAGVTMLLRAAICLRKRVVADEEGIGYAGKGKLNWTDIIELDARRLADKGILHLRYGQGNKLTLDSWKLDKHTFRDLVAFVERHVPSEIRRT
jgi:hypothetical protein